MHILPSKRRKGQGINILSSRELLITPSNKTNKSNIYDNLF